MHILYSYFLCTYALTTSDIGVGIGFQSYLDSLREALSSICWYDHRADDRQKVRNATCVLTARMGNGAHGVCAISDCKANNLDEICIGIVASIQHSAKKKNLITSNIFPCIISMIQHR